MRQPSSFWAKNTEELLRDLEVTRDGLTDSEASARLREFGPNRLRGPARASELILLLNQFKSPIILILLGAATLSIFLGDRPDAIIIMTIVIVSGLLGFWQERGAADSVEKLLQIIELKTTVRRDGKSREIPSDEVVPGDIVILSAGSTMPGDGLVIESHELFVDESALTGETFPVENEPGVVAEDAPLAKRTNALFAGTHVVSGSGTMLVVRTGRETEFGKVSERLESAEPETEFERGVRRFGYLLMEITLLLVIGIFAVNVYLHRPVLQSLLFSLALAVGLTPQLLPAIISINLAHGARKMAEAKVIVKRLAAIENFGSMNVLCSDKTGTLTEGVVRLRSAIDVNGAESQEVLRWAYLNSSFETGFSNPIDEAVRSATDFDLSGYRKLDEEPYDFARRRLSIFVEKDGHRLMVTKGSVSKVLDVCVDARAPDGTVVPLDEVRPRVQQLYQELSSQGYRTLGLAVRDDITEDRIGRDHEQGMSFAGILTLFDPPKADARETVEKMRSLGIRLKIITGDNALVAATLGKQMGIEDPVIVSGRDLHHASDAALGKRIDAVDIFAEIEPNQKEDIIHGLRHAGNVVGFVGDGINDASGLHAADVSISVNSAVDVAKEAADIVLLETDLGVLAQGVADGRVTFANTLKYVFMASSANFGNMFSMAGASLFLPFLPLLPTQVLLTNLMTDFPEMTIATDRVDPELVDEPRRWNVGFIRNFMLVFGPLSSVFDYMTFGVLLFVLHAGPVEFRTGWFIESVLSASIIVLVIRTRRPLTQSRPGRYLVIATVAVGIATVLLPYTPLGTLFQFRPLPPVFGLILALILLVYVSAAELTKHIFYRYARD